LLAEKGKKKKAANEPKGKRGGGLTLFFRKWFKRETRGKLWGRGAGRKNAQGPSKRTQDDSKGSPAIRIQEGGKKKALR